MTADMDSTRFGYLMRVLSERWPRPVRMPSLLHVSRDGGPLAGKLARVGFDVTAIRLQDTSLEGLSQRLAGRAGAFDVVCCCDLLEHADDWSTAVRELARTLRKGGVFFYSVAAPGPRRRGWLDRLARWWLGDQSGSVTPSNLHAILRGDGLLPQRLVGLGSGVGRPVMSRAAQRGAVAYMGYAFGRGCRDRFTAEGRRRSRTTAEHWVYVPVGNPADEDSWPARKAS
jgi:2-polyprenyl-6-hydroxyphenyl methylase / 3-demethylubiquinone-9 3-methyltransferase